MNVFFWLKMGMAIFLNFSEPQIILYDNRLIIEGVSISNLMTEEMIDLVNNGFSIGFELYFSAIITDKNGKRYVRRFSQLRTVKFSHLTEEYSLLIGDNEAIVFKTIDKLIEDARRFSVPPIECSGIDIKNVSVFFELGLLKNSSFEEKSGFETSRLWDNFKPSKRTKVILD